MRERNILLWEAEALVQSKRKIAGPNEGFLTQLRVWRSCDHNLWKRGLVSTPDSVGMRMAKKEEYDEMSRSYQRFEKRRSSSNNLPGLRHVKLTGRP
jgi:hypothetical protein